MPPKREWQTTHIPWHSTTCTKSNLPIHRISSNPGVTADSFRLAKMFRWNVYASVIVPVFHKLSRFVPGVLLRSKAWQRALRTYHCLIQVVLTSFPAIRWYSISSDPPPTADSMLEIVKITWHAQPTTPRGYAVYSWQPSG